MRVLYAQHTMYKTANLHRSVQGLQLKQILSKLDTRELVEIDMVQSETKSRIQSKCTEKLSLGPLLLNM